MIKPSIHLNGTSAEELFQQLCDALGAVRHLLATLEAAAPNARDYYVQGPDAYAQALNEHRDRVQHVVVVRRALEELAEHVADERDRRERR